MTGERAPSRTALGVAVHRAAHQLYDGDPKILVDPIAQRLLGADGVARLDRYRRSLRGAAGTALRSRVLLRSRFSEERLEAAVRRGVRQCVILGAGYDSFAYRQPDWAWGLRIFEVDHLATQTDKRRRLAAAGVPIPENLTFVDIDFERVSLADGLRDSALDFAAPTFFSCLGVLVYLTRESIDAIFQLVAGFPPGSEIAFTFSPTRRGLVSRMAVQVGALGEPWLTHLDRAGLERDLTALGFSEITFLEPAMAEAAYYRPRRRDGLRAPGVASIAAAIVGAPPS